MRWMLGFFAIVGLSVIGLLVAVGAGAIDPYAMLNSAGGSRRPDTRPTSAEAATTVPSADAGEEIEGPQRFKGHSLFLSAADARVAGPKVRIESTGSTVRSGWDRGRAVDPRSRIPNARISYWASPEDTAEWTLNCPEAGQYVIVFDCVPGYTGYSTRGLAVGKFNVVAGDKTLQAEVSVDTSGRYGSSSVYQVSVGKLQLPAGEVVLRISPAANQSGLLSLRSVRVNQAID